jgi:hypothetical protein
MSVGAAGTGIEVKVADTDFAEVIETTQDPAPLQEPPHALKLQPEAGATVSVTDAPLL